MVRPQDERITDAVLDSARELLGEVGYRNLTVEALATRARTTKPAIRRRWPSLKHVIVDAMATDNSTMAEPDTGCTHCDLVILVEELRRSMDDVTLGKILPALVMDLADDADLKRRFLTTAWQPRRERTNRILERGIARGELRPDLDLELAQDLLAATVVYRFLFAHAPLGPDVSEQIVEYSLGGIAGDAEVRHDGTCRTAHGDVRKHATRPRP
ncbi:TetR/AcrR family transcriptional regulator [Umezawaea endophytica]|uniref:TetR/AcrR family transcriptional regulator n=1 Tax=Umezawaea endophytica TaxID=1654476 RepID=A0A9X2VV04_9PSEU|nr:TetR/AcrR family transcriptional regulator [Umezawaea endophytica]MCS7483161.1 TetR/AcrR family transcriptional regulator [Umezawaea endophytica]